MSIGFSEPNLQLFRTLTRPANLVEAAFRNGLNVQAHHRLAQRKHLLHCDAVLGVARIKYLP